MRLQYYILTILLAAMFVHPAKAQQGQPPPPSFDNFLDEDDYDGPPGTPQGPKNNLFHPGNTQPPPNGGQPPPAPFPGPGFNNDNNPPSNVGGGGGSTAGSSGSKAYQKPTPRRRKENPAAISKKTDGKTDKKNLTEATDADFTDENFPDLIDSFDYPNADITDVIKAISELTGKNFIMDPSVKGKITIIAPSRITVAEAYKAFLSALAINNYTLVPSGKFLKVKPVDKALTDNIDLYAGNYSPNTDNVITRIIQLKYISAKDIVNNLGTVLNSRLGNLKAYEPTNTLIVSDYGSNIERIMKILRQLDVPGFEEQLEVIRIRYAKASDMAKLVDQIVNKGKTSSTQGGGFAAGIPRFGAVGGMGTGTSEAYSLVLPDERTNTLIVVGNSQGIDKIRKLVRKLDFKISPEEAGGVFVYYVKFGDAEKIAQTLQGLAQSSTAAQTNPNPFGAPSAPVKTNIFSGDVKVVADKTTNSIVVTASKQDYETIQAILMKLDIARNQVYVEGVIMEINVNNTRQWGMNFYKIPINNSFAGRSGFSSDAGAFKQFIDPSGDKGGIISFAGGDTIQITPPGQPAVNIPSLVGFVNFLAGVKDTNILSTPQIMAMDNEEAEIEVGDKVPVGNSIQTAANGQTSTSQNIANLTTKLWIKPHISPDSDTMRLEIKQDIAGTSQQTISAKNLADNAIATTTRNTKTNVVIHDGDTLVLGGLMRDELRNSVTKVPLLGDIPILGWLFKSKTVESVKLNLMMFLTPRIIRNPNIANQLLVDKMKERVNFIEKSLGGKDSLGTEVDDLKLEKNGKVQNLK